MNKHRRAAEGGAAEEHIGAERRPRQQGADRGRRHNVPDETREARVCRLREVPAVRFGSRPVLARIEAIGRDLCVHLRCRVIRHQGVRDGRGNIGVRGILVDVQRIHGCRDHTVDLGLRVGLGLLVAVAVDQAGAQGPCEVQVPQHIGALQQLPRGRVRRPLGRIVQGYGPSAAVMAASVWAEV